MTTTDMDIQIFETADTDADTDMKIFETADTDADTDMDFLKNRGHGHGTDSPRTRVSADLCWKRFSMPKDVESYPFRPILKILSEFQKMT